MPREGRKGVRPAWLAVAGCLLALGLLVVLSAEAKPTGALTQLAGSAGCVSETGSDPGNASTTCVDGKALDSPSSVAVSADGKSVYVTAETSDAVAVFQRNTTSGRLTQLAGKPGCVSETGSGDTCLDGKALNAPSSVAVSADGKNVYVASRISDAVAVFQRDTTTGALTQLGGTAGCVSETGSGGDCVNGKALDVPRSVAVTADGKSVYAASSLSGAVAVLSRNTTTGQLTQLAGTAGCVSDDGSGGACVDGRALGSARSVAASADGTSVYVAAGSPKNAVAVFARDTTTGQLSQPAGTDGCVSETGSGNCADGKALLNPVGITVSADGRNVYVVASASSAVSIFRRNTTTGRLTPLPGTEECTSNDGTGGQCVDGIGLGVPFSVAVSGDGKSVHVASVGGDAVASFRRDAAAGQLTQVPGIDGCISEDGSGGICADGRALNDPGAIALSPNGDHVYVASQTSDAVAVFRRATNVGQLTQLAGTAGCLSETGSGGQCLDGKALDNPRGVAASPDGKSLYVASAGASAAVATFERNTTTGTLSQLGCVSETGSGGDCADGKGLHDPLSVAVSPDGKNVYVAAPTGDSVAVFQRNTTTGQLTQLAGTAGCVSETGADPFDPSTTCTDGKALNAPSSVAVSADGKSVYVVSGMSDAVAIFERDTATGQLAQLAGTAGCMSETGSGGQCVNGKALDGARAVAVTADGKGVYVASTTSDAVAAFSRDMTSGQLTQLAGTAGCVSQTGSSGACADGKALDIPRSVAVSEDGKSLYAISQFSNAVAVFARNTTTGTLTQLAGTAGCVSEDGSSGICADGKLLQNPEQVEVSADGRSVYVVSSGFEDGVAVFRRIFTTGALTQLADTAGCVSETGSAGACADGKALVNPRGMAVSADGKNAYVTSATGGAVAAFARER